ncbi:hypothetical protein ACJQWK_10911 [Exserohilum turcicum]
MNAKNVEEAEYNPYHLLDEALSAGWESTDVLSAGAQQPFNSRTTSQDIAKCEKIIQERTRQQQSTSHSSSSASDTPVGRPAGESEDDKTRVAKYEQETASNYLTRNSFAEFTHHIKSAWCRTCKEPFFSSELDIRTLFQDWADGVVKQLSCVIKCKSCGTSSCIACIPEPFSRPSKIGFQEKKQCVSWCCVGGRLFIIWVLLCGFDRHLHESKKIGVTDNKANSDATSKKSNPNKKGKRPRRDASGMLHQSFMPRGRGYGTNADGISDLEDIEDIDMEDYLELVKSYDFFAEHGHMPSQSKPPLIGDKKAKGIAKARSAQMSEDRFGMLILGFLTDLLPSLERATRFDFNPPGAVLEMLQGSKILTYCTELLRNDSIIDIVKREHLYQTLFSFMTMMGSHPKTSEGLFAPRSTRPETIDLLTLSFCAAAPEPEERVPALASYLHIIYKPSSLVLKSANSKEDDFASDDGQTMLRICHQVSKLALFIEVNTRTEDKNTAAAIPEDLVIRGVEEKDIFPTHKYAQNAKSLTFSQPGRFKRIITEISTLQTSLPPGIFVRYCENRPDVLKCAIIGPLGTPYENGIFEFDFYCGPNFPNSPPYVSFKGTGGGTISINPNLYADGKVCLSLLGTWTGEPWKPGESTLLQVLISIQAMILCEEPWYNEPGREVGYHQSTAGSPSERYNQKLQGDTIRYALLEWLEKPPGLWKDVVAHHFTQHGDAILKRVEEWANDIEKQPLKRSQRTGADFQDWSEFENSYLYALGNTVMTSAVYSMMSSLETALQSYGATYKIKCVAPPPTPKPPGSKPLLPNPGALPSFVSPPSLMPHPGSFPSMPHTPPQPQPPPPPVPQFMQSTAQHVNYAPASPGHGGYVGRGQIPSHNTSTPGMWGLCMPPHAGYTPESSSGPPSSNTRSAAARGRGRDAVGSGGRGGPFHHGPGPFGRGGGVLGPSSNDGPGLFPGIFFESIGGGRGGGRGGGHGPGTGNLGGNGGRGGRGGRGSG